MLRLMTPSKLMVFASRTVLILIAGYTVIKLFIVNISGIYEFIDIPLWKMSCNLFNYLSIK